MRSAVLTVPLLVLAGCRSAPATSPDGWRKLELRDYTGALASFDAGLEEGESAELRAGRGRALYRMARLREAEHEFDLAVDLDPKETRWLVGRAVTRLAQGDTFGTVRDCDEALELDAGNAKAWFNRGLANQAAGSDELALEDFSRAIDEDSEFAEAYNNRGILLARSGRLTAAIQDFRTAAGLDPALADAMANLGAAHYTIGNSEQAFAALNAAIRVDRSRAGYYVNRGRICLDLGDAEGATLDFERALALSPGNQRIQALLARARSSARDRGAEHAAFDRTSPPATD